MPCYSKPPYIYSLCMLHKERVSLRPTVSFKYSPVYELYKYVLPIALSAEARFTVKDFKQFVSIVKGLILKEGDLMVSFDVINLFPSVPVMLNIVKDNWTGK